jgi:predicted RNA-binding Zn ribbon-like protein
VLKPDEIGPGREAGRLCLEFVNTLLWHASEHPEETLHSYADLVTWAQGVKLLSNHEAQKLLRDAAGQPAEAGRVLKRAAVLREAIYRIFIALIHGKSPAKADLDELNSTLIKMTSGARIIGTEKGFAWNWRVDEDALDSLIWPIALSAAELLVSEERKRVGQCADDRGCGWLFLDSSKNRTRRWCDINDCGNRAKQRRHYERTRKHMHAKRPL